MADKNKTNSRDNESTKKFKASCTNFIKMLAEEKSDSIKLTYFSGLTKAAQKLAISQEKTVEIIFKNILFEKKDILKTPNLLIAFISFCRKTHESTFQNHFYDLLYKFLGDYDDNNIYFKEYIITLSLDIFFDSIKNKGEKEEDYESRQKYFNLMIYTDIKEFKDHFFKMIINEKIKLMDSKIKINFLINFFEIIIAKNKYNIGIMLLQIINEETKKNLPDEIVDSMINFENKNGFNSIIKKKKEINDFLTFNHMLLEDISQEYINNKTNETKLDIYLSNLMNILCIKKEFNINILKYIFDYFLKYKSTMLAKIFPITIYYLSSYAYTNNQILFLFNNLCKNNLNPLYIWIIYKNPILFNKSLLIQTDFKPSLNGINIVVDDKSKIEKKSGIADIIEKSLITSEEISNIYLLVHLTLYDYILKSSIKINDNTYNLNFDSLNEILEIISKMSSAEINKSFFNEFIQFLIDYLSVLFDFFTAIKDYTNEKIIIKALNLYFKMLRKLVDSKDVQLSIIYPSLLSIMSNKNIKVVFLEPVIDYMIELFSRSSRLNDKIFKLIKVLLINKDQKNPSYKFFFADKLIDLVIKANEHKLFEELFKLCNELSKTKDDFNIKLNYYIINKYSKFYSGALSDLLQRYIIEKFDENFLQKKDMPIELINDENYYIINTIDNIYLQDKPTNLKDIIDKYFGDDYKGILNIIHKLFEFMDKEDNNKEVFKSKIKNNNIVEEYSYRKNLIYEILNYFSFVKKDYDNNCDNDIFKENKKIYSIYGTTYYLVHLLTQYLSEKIENEKNITNEEEKKKESDKLMIVFDYIYEKILLNKNIKNIIFKSFIINVLLSNENILNYYVVKHTNNLANLEIEKNQSDLSQLEQISSKINSKKSLGLIKLIKNNPYNIILLSDLILKIFDYESDNIINPKKINLYESKTKKYLIIENIYKNKLFDKITDYFSNINNSHTAEKNQISNSSINNNDQMRINVSFSKYFFKFITDLSNIKNLEINQIYYLFCLDNEIFNKYYNSFCDFYDIDYTIIQLYSLIRNKSCKLEFKEKFLEFIKYFIFDESINVFSLRIFSEEKTFNKLIAKCELHSEREILLLNDIIISLFENLLQYNSYKVYTEKIILNIINNIFSFTTELLSLVKNDDEKILNELNNIGKLIKYIYEKFTTENNNDSNQKETKLNKRINSNLIKNINKELDKYKINQENNKELSNFIKAEGILIKEDKQKRINLMNIDLLINNYVNNPEEYPFPIEEYMQKYCQSK